MNGSHGSPSGGEPSGVLRLGVLGCADIAWRRTLPALAGQEQIVLTAVASRSAERAARFAARFGGAAVTGYDRLLERDDIDAVYIPLPAGLHAEWAAAALRAGRHVLVEKPLATGADEALRLVGLAARQGRLLMENFMFLRHSAHAAVDRLVAQGAIGVLRGLHAAFTIPPKPAGDIRRRKDLAGGSLLDMGVYTLRTARRFLGDGLDGRAGLEVTGAMLREDPGLGVDLSGAALLTGAGGTVAQLSFGMEHSYLTRYELRGSEGRLVLDRCFTPPPGLQPVVHVERQDHREELVLPADDQFARVLGEFARTALSGQGFERHAQDALEQARLVERVRAAAVRVTAP